MKTTHLFTEETPDLVVVQLQADAKSAAVRRGAVVFTAKKGITKHDDALTMTEQSYNEAGTTNTSSSADSCLSSSLIMQLASINIKEEEKSTTPHTSSLKRNSVQFSQSKPLQKCIKVAKRTSAPPSFLASKKKRVHSRRRNRVVILNNKIMTSTTTQERRGSSDSCLKFESLTLGPIVTP
jgi:hypothetical protein